MTHLDLKMSVNENMYFTIESDGSFSPFTDELDQAYF